MVFYDVIIIGGGLVGAGLASAMREMNLRVALVDAKEPQQNDSRLFALNAGSYNFLSNIGVWPDIIPHAAPIHEVHVSCRGRFGAARLKREDVHLASLGYVVPARYIEKSLNEQLAAHYLHDIYRPAILSQLSQTEEAVEVTLTTPAGEIKLTTGLLVGADGATSTVRQLANIPVETADYQQSAIVTRTLLTRPHAFIAYERFTDSGTVAMLPLPGNECATIWSGKDSMMQVLQKMNDNDYLAYLQENIGYRLGRLQRIAARYTYPLKLIKAKTMTAGRIFLLGNAAHTMHPVAAQGFNLALYEAAVLIERIKKTVLENRKLLPSDLAAVYHDIKTQQAISLSVSHRLATQVSGEESGLSQWLSLGLAGFDLMTPFKRRFLEKIMGRTGRVPRLLVSMNT